jgi:hypothetical protein
VPATSSVEPAGDADHSPLSGARLRMSGDLFSLHPFAFSARTVTNLPLLLNVLCAQHCGNTIRNLRTDSLLGNGKLYGLMCCRQVGGSEFESRIQNSARRPDILTDIRGLPSSIQTKTEIVPLTKNKLRDTHKCNCHYCFS